MMPTAFRNPGHRNRHENRNRQLSVIRVTNKQISRDMFILNDPLRRRHHFYRCEFVGQENNWQMKLLTFLCVGDIFEDCTFRAKCMFSREATFKNCTFLEDHKHAKHPCAVSRSIRNPAVFAHGTSLGLSERLPLSPL